MKKVSPVFRFPGARRLALFAAAFAAMSAAAVEITNQANATDVRKAVQAWLAARAPSPDRARKVEGLRPVAVDGTVAAWAADLVGGGTVVLSANRSHAPIVAYSTRKTLSFEAGSPLMALVAADAALPQGAAQSGRWSPLVTGAVSSGSAKDEASMLDDVVVFPLVATEWGQDEVEWTKTTVKTGEDEDGDETETTEEEDVTTLVFNRDTPKNYYSGCVATALAQFMATRRWPTDAIAAFSDYCMVDGEKKGSAAAYVLKRFPADESASAWTFDWDAMSDTPSVDFSAWSADGEADKIDEAAAQMGALLYACGVGVHMQWDADGSGAVITDAAGALTNRFGYAAAKSCIYDPDDAVGALEYGDLVRILGSNLDFGLPVQLGINDDSGASGHAILCDGYGYADAGDGDRQLYYHLNMGWDGQDDIWYALPRIDASDISFTVVNSAVYNVFEADEDDRPAAGDEIVAGRVVDEDGNAVAGATVSLGTNGVEFASAVTGTNGVFAFRVPGGVEYSLGALSGLSAADASGEVPVSTCAVVSYKAGEIASTGTIGNVWGVELAVSSTGAGDFGSVAEAVNAPQLEFSWDGDASWFGQVAESADGKHAAQSGAVGDGGVSSVSTTVSTEGADEAMTLSFAWKTASEAGADHLRFYLDGVETGRISGDSDWSVVEVALAPGATYDLKWEYAKDSSLSKLADAAWVDKVALSTGAASDFELWMERYFPDVNASNYLARGRDDDDGDGQTNLQEYVAGTDPTDPDDRLRVTGIAKDDGTAEISWAPAGKEGRTYTVQTSPEIGAGESWSDADTGVASPWTDESAAEDAKFYRVKVEMDVEE